MANLLNLDDIKEIDHNGWVGPNTEKPHVLIITIDEDDCSPDYEENRQWEVVHHPECKRATVYSDDGREIIADAYDCGVGWEIQNVGLDSLEDKDGLTWDQLEPGSYLIEFWATVTRSYGGEEYENGLTVIEGPL